MDKVIFKKFEDGEIIAFFPEMLTSNDCVNSYMHTGQHGEASISLMNDLEQATPEESKELHNELKNIVGYDI